MLAELTTVFHEEITLVPVLEIRKLPICKLGLAF